MTKYSKAEIEFNERVHVKLVAEYLDAPDRLVRHLQAQARSIYNHDRHERKAMLIAAARLLAVDDG